MRHFINKSWKNSLIKVGLWTFRGFMVCVFTNKETWLQNLILWFLRRTARNLKENTRLKDSLLDYSHLLVFTFASNSSLSFLKLMIVDHLFLYLEDMYMYITKKAHSRFKVKTLTRFFWIWTWLIWKFSFLFFIV